MTARQTTTGTPADGYKIPAPIPRPRSNSDDPTEPGARRRNTDQQEKQR